MSGQVTIESAVEALETANTVRKREAALSDLKHVLRYNQQNSRAVDLSDKAFLWLYQKLFGLIIDDKSTWLSTKSATVQKSAEARLSDAAPLRLAVELGVQTVSLGTARAVIDHVLETLPRPGGGICFPFALDYVRCLRILLSHQPHLEHLPRKEWDRILHFCIRTIQDLEGSSRGGDTKSGAERTSRLGNFVSISSHASRSQMTDSSQSQSMRMTTKQVWEELINCLHYLTAVPNASLTTNAKVILWTLIDYLKGHTVATSGSVHGNAFAAINHILLWARTDNMALVKKATGQIIRLVQHFWASSSKGSANLTDELLITLLYLKPYMIHMMEHEEVPTMRSELSGLAEILRSEYSKRGEKDQLPIDDLRLAPCTQVAPTGARIGTAVLELRSANIRVESASSRTESTALRSERAWALVDLLATVSTLLRGQAEHATSDNDEEGEDDIQQRSRKRQRLADDHEDVLNSTDLGGVTSRLTSLQIVAFVAQQKAHSTCQLGRTIDKLIISCNDDNANVSSWALLAVACCASQERSADETLSLRWASMWQLAYRAMSNTGTCRAACHLLDIMLRLQLAAPASVAELTEGIVASMELSGPCLLVDSSLHFLRSMLRATQQSDPAKVSTLAEGMLAWLCRRYAPSLFEDKSHAASYHRIRLNDVVQLVSACLDHEVRSRRNTNILPVWHPVAQTILACQEQRPLMSYLLLEPEHDNFMHVATDPSTPSSVPTSSSGRLPCESLFLNQIIPELQKTLEAWSQLRRQEYGALTTDMVGYLCQAGCVLSEVALCNTFRDTRRQSQMQKQIDELFHDVAEFAASSKCNEDVLTVLVQAISPELTGMALQASEQSHTPTASEALICRHLGKALSSRREARDFGGVEDDDMMDMNESHDSQGSRHGKATPRDSGTISDTKLAYSLDSLRANAGLYMFALTLADEARRPPSGQSASPSLAVTDYLLSLSIDELIASRKALSTLPKLGLLLSAADAERLLEHCTEHVLSAYTYERTEVAQGTMLALMSSLMPIWTDPSQRSIFDLGIDMYEWYVRNLAAGVLSVKVQLSFSALLLDLCNVDVEYGRLSDVQSARTSLFKLVQVPSIRVHYFLANRISQFFGLFVLSEHDKVFADLQANLPSEIDWIEGLAMRLLFLARMAASWHTLLRTCVYYMFETAGRVKEAAAYATHGIKDLSTALGFPSAQKLFRLFASQLLHTWLEQGTLTGLPFLAFEYRSLDHLIQRNQSEIIAQLVLRGKEDGLHVVSKALGISEKEMVKRSFAQVEAYAISGDTRHKDATPTESRVRHLVGKDEVKVLATRDFAAIMGHYLLAMQQDDVDDKWLGARPEYAAAFAALEEMKTYSSSKRALPPGLQPSFKSKSLPFQIERLCRRSPRQELLDASSFTLAARMLLDAIDPALGPLHMCLILRKLRLLIALAGGAAVTGFALEMLVHSVRPLLSDSHCADDAIGILQYLLHHGRSWLEAENMQLINGTSCVMILQMQAHSAVRQESTTQETQRQQTAQKMDQFQAWLIKYLRQFYSSTGAKQSDHPNALATALAAVKLPGNARKGTAESALLVILLEQLHPGRSTMSEAHSMEAMRLLTKGFDLPLTAAGNCMERDETCSRYAQSLWRFISSSSNLEDRFVVWAGEVIGRAYSSNGMRPSSRTNIKEVLTPEGKPYEGIMKSQAEITRRLVELMLSPDRSQASLADWTIRTIVCKFKEPADGLAFEQMLPASFVPVVADGTYGYEPHTASEGDSIQADLQHLRKALDLAPSEADELWNRTLAVTLCHWDLQSPVLASLPALLRNTPRLATDLLPCIAHIMLESEAGKDPVVRTELSSAIAQHFASRSPSLKARQQLLIRILLYLRSQPLPGEANVTDRMKWLDVDLLLAADTSAWCGMPCTSLLFAESSRPIAQPSRRASSRASLSQLESVDVPEDLLLSVFAQVDEPDSFYGVQQPASLDSMMSRLDYEADGIKSLMFRSARMDSAMRLTQRTTPADSNGMMRALSALNLHSLEYTLVSGSLSSSAASTEDLLNTARRLQQWDIASPESPSTAAATRYSAFQHLSHAATCDDAVEKLRSLVLGHMQRQVALGTNDLASTSWCNVLTSLTETLDIMCGSGEAALHSQWSCMQSRHLRLQSAYPEDAAELATDRSVLFGVISQNGGLLKDMHVNLRSCRAVEVESLLNVARLARSNGNSQEALSAVTQLSLLSADTKASAGLNFSAASLQETAAVLWDAGEAVASVKMLRAVLAGGDAERQHLPIGESGLLATLARQLADARLEQPDQILEKCLRPAIKHLKNRDQGKEAGKVFYEFAAFCDRQLQHPGNLEDFQRITKLREKKRADVEELDQLAKKSRNKVVNDSKEARQARAWLKIDDAEYQSQKKTRDDFLQQSLQNYLLALHASDDHDICVLRFFAMWLESSGSSAANSIVAKHLRSVPSWKFVVLNNQLMSRLEHDASEFQVLLSQLMQRICADHPYHSLYHLFSATRKPQNHDAAANSRCQAADGIRGALRKKPDKVDLLNRVFQASRSYEQFALSSVDSLNGRLKASTKQFKPAEQLVGQIRSLHIPPATISIALHPHGDYSDVPEVTAFGPTMSVMGGLSRPKALTALASDGKYYKQLFKGTKDDDLRQDAIMEQVFEEVSKMLRNHKATRKRNLHVRTYKVIPLGTKSGIMEWVANSVPIGEWLKPAHLRYYPKSMKHSDAANMIKAAEGESTEERVETFHKVCEQMPPVMRHFFFEHFNDPDEWFEKRTAYTRTTAAISILGHVLGLGDRHCHNIMLDEVTGEAVHIDLGVAFEAGKILPVPEKVPFRLSRDIVDAMGITKTEGVFRRCCEFTMDALREDKDSIMTLLNVLRYDPLYNWTLSPLRAKRMQDAQQMTGNARNEEEASSRAKQQEAGEADRALSIVEKKLSTTLSTAATVNELIQQAMDDKNLATLFCGWSAFC